MIPYELLTPGEVAAKMRVDPKTVTRWAAAGKFLEGETIKTPGGHLRIKRSAMERLLNQKSEEEVSP